MVTIGLSTLSVITSIFVFRLNDSYTSPVPPLLHVIAFRYVARVLCCMPVSRTARCSPSVVPVCDRSSTTTNCSGTVTDTVDTGSSKTDLDIRTASTQGCHCCQLKPQVDIVLDELRKVTICWMTTWSWFTSILSSFAVKQ